MPSYLLYCPRPFLRFLTFDTFLTAPSIAVAIAHPAPRFGFGDNTYLIVASDNGGDKTGVGSSYPYKGQKGSAWNGGVAAAAFVHSKLLADSVQGTSYRGLMHVTDWLPTLMHLASGGLWAGTPLSGKEVDGIDMWPALAAGAPSPRTEILHYHDGDGSVIQIGDYKMLTAIKVREKWAMQWRAWYPVANNNDHPLSLPPRPSQDTKGFAPVYAFPADADPASMHLQCAAPSLMTATAASVFDGLGLSAVTMLFASPRPVAAAARGPAAALGVLACVLVAAAARWMLRRAPVAKVRRHRDITGDVDTDDAEEGGKALHSDRGTDGGAVYGACEEARSERGVYMAVTASSVTNL